MPSFSNRDAVSMLCQMGFGFKWRNWIAACRSSASISIMINGPPSNEFKMERGLCQGDPLSPFLFLVVVEALQSTILESCNKGEWSRLNANTLLYVLKWFGLASGLKVNISKNRLMGIGVSDADIAMFASLLGYTHGSILFIYLGLPIGRKMQFCKGWIEIINRFCERLSYWKAKSFSVGGRLTLIKSILGSLSTYYLSLFKDPMKVLC
ncbi:hypothetical protein Tco_1578243 [Tanacetum coccineum]